MPQAIDERRPAPDFTLPATDGGDLRLRDLRGKPAVIYFYPKDDTSACTAEALDFTCLVDKFRAAGIELVGIAPGTLASKLRFRDKHNLTVRLAADVDHAVAEAYGVWVEKSMYGRRYMGVERTTFLIDPEGRIAQIWRKVKVKGHAEEVFDAARKLLHPKVAKAPRVAKKS